MVSLAEKQQTLNAIARNLSSGDKLTYIPSSSPSQGRSSTPDIFSDLFGGGSIGGGFTSIPFTLDGKEGSWNIPHSSGKKSGTPTIATVLGCLGNESVTLTLTQIDPSDPVYGKLRPGSTITLTPPANLESAPPRFVDYERVELAERVSGKVFAIDYIPAEKKPILVKV